MVGSVSRRVPSVAEMSKLEAEINFLKRSLDVGKSSAAFCLLLLCTVFSSVAVWSYFLYMCKQKASEIVSVS